MRILQVITPSRISGAERSTASLCEHLAAAGHQVTVACKRGHPLVDFLRGLGLDVRPLDIAGKANLAAAARIARLAHAVRADVVHTQLSTAALWGSLGAHLAGVPAVAHVRALNSRTCYLLADRIIAVSGAVRAHLVAQGMEADRIDVVYSGMDPRRYHIACSRAEARRQLDLDTEALVVGVVAHLTPKKGHAVFLDALARVVQEHPEAVAILAGEGPLQPELERRAAELGLGARVRFLGYREDVLPVYAALDLLVLPSVAGEGLPRTLLEAGFLGLPTVGTRLSGVPEIIAESETGFIVPPDDPEALAARISALLEAPGLRERMGEAARARIRAGFTVEAMVAGTLRAYRAAGARES